MSGILGPLSRGLDAITALNDHYYKLSIDEQKAMSLMQRIQYYNWTFETICVLIFASIYLVFEFGVKYNTKRADKLFEALNWFFLDGLKFARAGFSHKDGSKTRYVKEQNGRWFTTFATGRSSIESIVVKAHYFAWFNPLAMIMERVLAQFFPKLVERDAGEHVKVVIRPNGTWCKDENSPVSAMDDMSKFKFITSIVHKSHMTISREKNYFLSLTHTAESDLLPREYVFMSENNQLNQFFSVYAGRLLSDVLPKCAHFLQFIAFTDLPEERPVTDKLWESTQSPRCVIHCSSISRDSDIELLKELVSIMVEVYDTVTREIVNKESSVFLTQDLLKRSVQLRKTELAKIIRIMEQVEREMAMEKKAEEERKKRQEQRNTLGSDQLSKMDQKMKEKRERRRKNKMAGRM
ncbi:HER187Wp [Eremothecium sinecaudum]|uniref:HER187Wp n=1 Tax=Eremothecium sinecaudum TaxID=45286 RepID=A0A109UZL4_9SACH|nr:HER187Wp [Eremothecium sinecaudum]AMD21466.1 HER187Wp [Eremothecium sinecaudum]